MRLMAVHAHPDDESSKGAATLASYAAAGHDILVLTCTGGERGEILNSLMDRTARSLDEMRQLRSVEMACAAQVLGVQQAWLGCTDSGMDDPSPPGSFAASPLDELVPRVVQLMRAFRPHVVVTYDETGGYPHPDHIRTHDVTVAAFDAAGDPTAYADLGSPWQPLKLYYVHMTTKEQVSAVHEGMVAHGLTSPYADWLATWDDRGNRVTTTRVPCADFYEVRRRALLAHASQIDPYGPWFHIPLDVQRCHWPTEDYEAAVSFVPIAPGEDCLFAGLGTDEEADELARHAPDAPLHDTRPASRRGNPRKKAGLVHA